MFRFGLDSIVSLISFETLPRMLACVSIDLIVAWRTLYVCRLGRSGPDIDWDLIFDPAEWQSVWSVCHRGKPWQEKPPPLKEMVRLIARLGGYGDRPNRRDLPGVETVWKGMLRMQDLAWAGKRSYRKRTPRKTCGG